MTAIANSIRYRCPDVHFRTRHSLLLLEMSFRLRAHGAWLICQKHAQQRVMDFKMSIVVNEAQLPLKTCS